MVKTIPSKQEKNENLKKRHRERIGGEIAIYIYDYDFKAVDYPDLQLIIEELIKRKSGNVYADIFDLLGKL
jgi:hypothetical protein